MSSATHYQKRKSSDAEKIDYAFIPVNCPHMPRRQVNQIAATTNSSKTDSISLGVSDSPNSPNLSVTGMTK